MPVQLYVTIRETVKAESFLSLTQKAVCSVSAWRRVNIFQGLTGFHVMEQNVSVKIKVATAVYYSLHSHAKICVSAPLTITRVLYYIEALQSDFEFSAKL